MDEKMVVELVEKQANDEGLWFIAETAPEAYLQKALRELHSVIERGRTLAPEMKEAYDTISEWGINEDGYIMANFKNFMSGGNPDDNSIQLSEFYQTQLKYIVNLGLTEAQNTLGIVP